MFRGNNPKAHPSSPELILTNCMVLCDRGVLAVRNTDTCRSLSEMSSRLVVLMEGVVELRRSGRWEGFWDRGMENALRDVISATKHAMRIVDKSLSLTKGKDLSSQKCEEAKDRLLSASLVLSQAVNTVLLEGSPRASKVLPLDDIINNCSKSNDKNVESSGDNNSSSNISVDLLKRFSSARTAIAVCDRDPQGPNELALKEGDIIAIIPKMEELYWWTGLKITTEDNTCITKSRNNDKNNNKSITKIVRGITGTFPIDTVLMMHPITRFVRIGRRNIIDWYTEAEGGRSRAASAPAGAIRPNVNGYQKNNGTGSDNDTPSPIRMGSAGNSNNNYSNNNNINSSADLSSSPVVAASRKHASGAGVVAGLARSPSTVLSEMAANNEEATKQRQRQQNEHMDLDTDTDENGAINHCQNAMNNNDIIDNVNDNSHVGTNAHQNGDTMTEVPKEVLMSRPLPLVPQADIRPFFAPPPESNGNTLNSGKKKRKKSFLSRKGKDKDRDTAGLLTESDIKRQL